MIGIVFDLSIRPAKDLLEGKDLGVPDDYEEEIFLAIREAFTELIVEIRQRESIGLVRREFDEIHSIMDAALAAFRGESVRRRPLEVLKGILLLPEEEILTADPRQLFGIK